MMKNFKFRAFTLIEVLVAMLILAIGLLGLAGMTVVVLRSNVLSQQTTDATSIANDLMQRLRRVDFSNLNSGGTCDAVIADSATGPCADAFRQSGLFDLNAGWPTNDGGCVTNGILSQNDRSFDVVRADLSPGAADGGDFCGIIQNAAFDSEQYLRFYRVIEVTATSSRVVVGVLFRDRFQRWRVQTLDTLRFDR
ncbi:MAG: prepilin-type N-terminal cleavage/methylation domain-containing protein [Bradymonadales bacterium]|nr:MAG: prepilin-type N-terminal cleavage/methylation domain-containing protein [Bradymonadales bacterium]